LHDGLLGALHDQTPAVIHLAGVAFLDCAGVDILAAVYNTAAQSGCSLRVLHPQPIVRRVLEVTGLLGVLTTAVERRQPLPARVQIPAGDWIGHRDRGTAVPE
jgi:anti-anti-sigma factor